MEGDISLPVKGEEKVQDGLIPSPPPEPPFTAKPPSSMKIKPKLQNIRRDRSIASIRGVPQKQRSPRNRRRQKRRSSVVSMLKGLGSIGRGKSSIDSNDGNVNGTLNVTSNGNININNDSDEDESLLLLEKEHDTMIEDYGIRSLRPAQFFKDQEDGKIEQKIKNKLGNKKHNIPIFRQSSKFRIRWDALIMLFVLYSSFQIPYDSCFRITEAPQALRVLESLVDVFFAVDLVLNFRTTYIEDHIEIFDGKKIVSHYFRNFFIIDFLATVPFELIFGSVVTSLGWLGVLKMVRLLRLGRLVKKLDDVTAAGLFRLFRIILGILLLLHWLACMLRVVIITEDRTQSDNIWGNHIVVVDGTDTDYDVYFSYMYSTICMVFRSIDTHPVTTLEKIFVGVVTIFGSMVQSVLFGSVVVLISSFDASQVEYNRHSVDVVQRLKQLGVPRPIIRRTKKFLDLLWTNQHSKGKLKMMVIM